MKSPHLGVMETSDDEAIWKARTLFERTERLARFGHWQWDEIENRCVFCSPGMAGIAGVTPQQYLERASSFEGDVD